MPAIVLTPNQTVRITNPGAVVVVDTPNQFIQTGITATRGETGPAGATGATGPQGATGATGGQGSRGQRIYAANLAGAAPALVNYPAAINGDVVLDADTGNVWELRP